MRKFCLPLLITMLLLLAACAPAEIPAPALEEAPAGEIMAHYETETLELTAGGAVYSEIEITRLVLSREEGEDAALAAVNESLAAIEADFISGIAAEQGAMFAADPSLLFQLELVFTLITVNEDIISITLDSHMLSQAAAHSNFTRSGYVFNAADGSRAALSSLLGADFEESVVAAIWRLIEESGETEQYYPDLTRLLLKYLNADSGWYADEQSIRIIYQPYEIAPGTLGLLEFSLPY